jgi:hypothetical protein
MSKRIFIAFITILSLLWGFGIHETLVQAQGPPLIPPHGIWGVPSVDGVPLDKSDTGYTISVKMVQLLLIFLHELDDQGTIATIVAELDIGVVTTLQQAFLDSEYCQSRTPPTELSSTATVTVQVAGDEWLVSDGGKNYTVKRIDIPVWDPILEDWIDGSRLEVYEHDGEIASYTMGELPVDYFVVQIPMNSAGILWGDIDGGDYFVLREAGTAMVGDEAFLCINNIPIIDPPGPYIITEDAFVGMNINAPSTYQFSIEFVAGWNLFSIPVQLLITDPSIVLQPIAGKYNGVWAYDPDTGSWKIFDPLQTINDLNELQAGVGYWILMNEAANLDVEGLLADTAIQLVTGWNLVGYNSLVAKRAEQCLATIKNDINGVWGYDPDTGGWKIFDPLQTINDLEYMDPGLGYWILSNSDIVWDIGQ